MFSGRAAYAVTPVLKRTSPTVATPSPSGLKRRVSALALGEALRPLSHWPLLFLSVHLEIHLLVEVAQVPLYLGSLRYRLRIVPDEVLHSPTANLDGVVGGHTLVRALGLLIARD